MINFIIVSAYMSPGQYVQRRVNIAHIIDYVGTNNSAGATVITLTGINEDHEPAILYILEKPGQVDRAIRHIGGEYVCMVDVSDYTE